MNTKDDPHAELWTTLAATVEALTALCTPEQAREICEAIDRLSEAIMRNEPIDMILHCPACGEQHVDAPARDSHAWCNECKAPPAAPCYDWCSVWDNPPHRSHLCHGCGHIWRPADVPTNGVREIKTRGKNDSVPAS